jgi:hypothetical protein
MQAAALATARRLAPAAALVAAVTCVWLGTRALTRQFLGPRGFEVTLLDATGATLGHAVVPVLLTPEEAPRPPVGGTLVARATFLARESGKFTWQLGGTSPVTLFVDGRAVHTPRPGRVAAAEQLLAAGAHALELRLTNANAAGGIAFATRPPSTPWHSPLVGPDDVTTLPLADARARLGAHPALLLAVLDWLPTLVTLALALIAFAAIGANQRRRLDGYVRALAADPSAPRVGMALLLALVVLPMIAPLFQPGFYACHEEESYIVRLGEYLLSLRGGVPMGRWWPDPVLGRGYPFLCLYAPLLYIVATPFLLLGFSALATVKLITGGLVVVGTLAVYGLARRRASRPAALLAAALFTWAPYLQTDLWIRADLAESLGFACFPLALWALERALDATRPTPWADVAWLGLALMALGSCHNITAYFSVYFLTLWLLLRLWLRTVPRAGLKRAVAGGGLGLLLTVFYAVPAIGDAKRVWMERVMTGYYYAFRNFVPLDKMLIAEPMWGTMRLYVGVAGTLALVGGIAALLAKRPRNQPLRGGPANARLLALLGATGVLLALLLATRPIGVPVVRYVPLAEYVQFPWRMFLFVSCLAPLCVPAAVDGFLPASRHRWAATVALVALLIVVCTPRWGAPGPLVRDRLDVQTFLRGLEIDYVTSMNEYLPKTVRRTVPRFGDVAHVIDGDGTLTAATRRPGHYEVVVDGAQPSLIEFNAHWFPGWRARVDGVEQPIGPGYANFDTGGLTRLRVPKGKHHLQLDYGRTPLRLVCDLISLLALALLLALFGLAARDVLGSRRARQG